MTHKIPFLKEDLVLEDSWEAVSMAAIDALVPAGFPDRENFVHFYLAANGGYFTRGCVLYRDHFYDVSQDGYTTVEVESFNFIPRYPGDDSPVLLSIKDVWERKSRYSPALKTFSETHLPFAADAGDNDYWLSFETGLIKKIIWEENDDPTTALLVAPSFTDFCRHLQLPRR